MIDFDGKCWNCGTDTKGVVGRHFAPCGAVCSSGCLVNVPDGERVHLEEKEMHTRPWEGPPDTDGHYHGECPKGCFAKCCEPRGNLCGEKCQRCFPRPEENQVVDPPRCEAVHPVHGRCMRDAGHPVDAENGHETAVASEFKCGVLVQGIDGEPVVRWPRRWMVRELLDDHRHGKAKSRNAIGLLLVPGALPRLVACGDPAQVARWAERGDEPTYCCCEVYRDQADGTEHLSSWSVLTLSGKQLADLHLYGEIAGSAMAYSACRVVLLDEEEDGR